MQLTFLERDTIKLKTLPQKIRGQYTIDYNLGGNKEVILLTIEATQINGEFFWNVKSSKYAKICDEDGSSTKNLRISANKIYRVAFVNSNETALLVVDELSKDNITFSKFCLSQYGKITIGKSEENDIVFDNQFVSRNHATIEMTKDGISVLDTNSTNGTYVDGARINASILKPGSVVYIIGLKIIIGNSFFSINNPNGTVIIHEKLEKYTQEIVQLTDDEDVDDEINFFSRAPRFVKPIIRNEFKVDPPPQVQNAPGIPMIYMLGPSITMGMSSMLMGYFTVTNVLSRGGDFRTAMPTLSMSITMMIGMILWPLLTKRYEKKKKDEREALRQEKYTKYLSDLIKDIKKLGEIQSKKLIGNYLPVNECIEKIRNKNDNLWDRQYQHGDFLEVRLGIGTIPMFADFKFPEWRFSLDDDNLQNTLQEVANRPKILENVPIVLSFIKEYVSGIIGDRNQVLEYMKSIIFQLVSLHSYDELKVVLICDEEEKSSWQFAKWLPHVFSEDKNMRFFATDAEDVKALSTYLENIFIHRAELSDDKMLDEHEHYLIVLASKALASKAEIVKSVLKRVKRSEKYIGFSIISLYDEVKNLPKECTCVIELEENSGKLYSNFNVTEDFIEFKRDTYVIDNPEELSKELLNTILDIESGQFKLPEMYTFLDMYHAGKVDHLNIMSRWYENNPVLSLKAPIGIDTYGDVFNLDLHEKFHGPHGLIAGMTGSGKSEFIMTYILSMAVNYHPNEVAFILIDFKGGGMADTFNHLPHVAGKITNLDGNLMSRSLVSIESELKRRQRIFSETSSNTETSNVDIYKYQQLFREGKVLEPIQHLIIISDEFAELKSQQPEFMDKLISAARIGRSLGVHLILATQKPSGVVNDQIWSNSKFRICLKVQEKADSMEMIKQPEAASISETGRYYIQVGYNELFEMGQSAWAGAPYYPSEDFEERDGACVAVIDQLGRELRKSELTRKGKVIKNPTKQIDSITRYIHQLAKEEKIEVRKLWLEPLAELIYLEDLIDKSGNQSMNARLNPIIGVLDDPELQRQALLTLPISEKGNTIVYGTTESGKATFVTTVIYSIIMNNLPSDVHIYLLDFGSQTLKAFDKAPHVGDVIFSDEKEKINNLFLMLNRVMATRRSLLGDYGGDIHKYRKSTGQKLESILTVINNFGSFSELYNEYLDDLKELTANGLKYGLYFIITANSTNEVRYRMVQNFNQLFALNFNDDSEYSAVVGHTDGLRPSKYKGRGLVKLDKVYEYQIARVSKNLENTFEFLKEVCQNKKEEFDDYKAPQIPVLPTFLEASYFKECILEMNSFTYPIGIDKGTLQTIEYDLNHSCVQWISSSDADLSLFIQGITEVMRLKDNVKTILVDPKCELSKEYEAIQDGGEAVKELLELMILRNNTYKDSETYKLEKPVFEPIICIINGYSDLLKILTADFIDNLKLLLEKNELCYNVRFVIADDARKITLVKNDGWFKKHCDDLISVWIGDSIMQNIGLLKLSKYNNELYADIGEEYGYIIRKNKIRLMKYIQSSQGL